MQVVRTLSQLQALAAAAPCLVPTMGALHAGHMALIAAARRHAPTGVPVIASIFVNPTQFAANEDLERYPRQEAMDFAMLEEAGCDLVWLPDVTTMYLPDDSTTVDVGGPAQLWEGAQRPGHFRGVATVVAKLFGQIRPAAAFFGEKDWQQLQVVSRMVADLHLHVQIVGVPTVREPDGLAMSSRNVYLTAEQRQLAPRLYAELQSAAAGLMDDPRSLPVCDIARTRLAKAGFVVDYFEVVEPHSLAPMARVTVPARLIAAARLGPVRLLDNIAVAPILGSNHAAASAASTAAPKRSTMASISAAVAI
jgi:pantoate--beta-alanine ligase